MCIEIRKDFKNNRVVVTQNIKIIENKVKIEILEDFRELAWEIILLDSTLDKWEGNELKSYFDLEQNKLTMILEGWKTI